MRYNNFDTSSFWSCPKIQSRPTLVNCDLEVFRVINVKISCQYTALHCRVNSPFKDIQKVKMLTDLSLELSCLPSCNSCLVIYNQALCLNIKVTILENPNISRRELTNSTTGKILAQACGIPVGRRSDGRLAMTLVATKNDIIFSFYFYILFLFSLLSTFLQEGML